MPLKMEQPLFRSAVSGNIRHVIDGQRHGGCVRARITGGDDLSAGQFCEHRCQM